MSNGATAGLMAITTPAKPMAIAAHCAPLTLSFNHHKHSSVKINGSMNHSVKPVASGMR